MMSFETKMAGGVCISLRPDHGTPQSERATMTERKYTRRKVPAIGSTWRAIEDTAVFEWADEQAAEPPQSPTVTTHALAADQAQKADDLADEIDLIASQMEAADRKVTAATVMAVLMERAGRPDTCVKEALKDERAVKWERGSSGDYEYLSMPALKARIARRKERGNSYAGAAKGNAMHAMHAKKV